jgi:hypothetical protein
MEAEENVILLNLGSTEVGLELLDTDLELSE